MLINLWITWLNDPPSMNYYTIDHNSKGKYHSTDHHYKDNTHLNNCEKRTKYLSHLICFEFKWSLTEGGINNNNILIVISLYIFG